MMTIFEALREDHDKLRSLLSDLCKTEGNETARRDLYRETKDTLQRHEAAEERYFYIPLMKDDRTQGKTRHSVAEHNGVDEFLETLDGMEFSSPQWLPTARKLQDHVLHHLDEEEKEVFQLAGKVLDKRDKNSLAKDYRQMMDA